MVWEESDGTRLESPIPPSLFLIYITLLYNKAVEPDDKYFGFVSTSLGRCIIKTKNLIQLLGHHGRERDNGLAKSLSLGVLAKPPAL